MTMDASVKPAEPDQFAHWNGPHAKGWVADRESFDKQLAALNARALALAAPRPGDFVLDIGCGCGTSSLALAEGAGEAGHVLAADISAVMLGEAARRARAAGRDNLSFMQADAETHAFISPDQPWRGFDLVFSRFGVMFFANPKAAFRNIAGAMAANGRLCFVCWQAFEKNPWMALPARIAERFVDLPPRPDPHAPGPFSLADPGRIHALLSGAGLEDIAIETLEEALPLAGGGGMEHTLAFVLSKGPWAAALREAPREASERFAEALAEELEAFVRDEAVVMESAAWLVSARRPPWLASP